MLHPPARHQDLCNDFLHIALKDSSLTTGILVDLDMLEKWRGDPKLTPPKKKLETSKLRTRQSVADWRSWRFCDINVLLPKRATKTPNVPIGIVAKGSSYLISG